MAGRGVTVADENHIARTGLQHERKILPGHYWGRIPDNLAWSCDFACDFHCEVGLARMVHSDGVAATVLDTSRCAVGGRNAERHLAHSTHKQIADLRQKRSHRSRKLRGLRNDVGGSPTMDSADSDDP